MRGKSLIVLVIMCISMLIFPCVYADVDAVTTVQSGQAQITSICNQANNSVGGTKILKYTSKTGNLTFSNTKYSKLSQEKKTEFMKTALGATRKSGLGVKVKNKVYNFIADQDSPMASSVRYLQNDVSADFVEARAWFAPFSGPISTLMGLLCVFIFTFLSLSILVDLAYLALPAFQLLLERGEPSKRPVGVSNEAWEMNKKVESGEVVDNSVTAYLKKRIPVVLLISISLAYLISGKIYSIIVFIMDAFLV